MKTSALNITGGGVSKRGRKRKSTTPKNDLYPESSKRKGLDKSKINVNGALVDIESISEDQLYSLRKVLPRKEYRLLKNRKSARKSRKRRKVEMYSLKDEIDILKQENEDLRAQLRIQQQEIEICQQNHNGLELNQTTFTKDLDSTLNHENDEQLTRNSFSSSNLSSSLMMSLAPPKIESQAPNLPIPNNSNSHRGKLELNLMVINDALDHQAIIITIIIINLMATFVEQLVEKTVNVITNDGRNFIGTLVSFDQKTNLILSACIERIYIENHDVQAEEMGVFFIRGDNVCLIAEIDENLERGIDYSKIRAQPIKSVLLH
eukprot:403355067